jgi:hypothetical protein
MSLLGDHVLVDRNAQFSLPQLHLRDPGWATCQL